METLLNRFERADASDGPNGIFKWDVYIPSQKQNPLHLLAYPNKLHPAFASELIKGLSNPGDKVLDPFCGSGTILVEALNNLRTPIGGDINPLAYLYTKTRLNPPSIQDVKYTLDLIPITNKTYTSIRPELIHQKTWDELNEILDWIIQNPSQSSEWIKMVILHQLTGKNLSCLSNTTFPGFKEPEKYPAEIIPPYKNTKTCILQKTQELIFKKPFNIQSGDRDIWLKNSFEIKDLASESIQLLVTNLHFGSSIQQILPFRHETANWNIRYPKIDIQKIAEKTIRHFYNCVKTNGHIVLICPKKSQETVISAIQNTGIKPLGIVNNAIILKKIKGQKPEDYKKEITQDIPLPYSHKFFLTLKNIEKENNLSKHELLNKLIQEWGLWEKNISPTSITEIFLNILNKNSKDPLKHHKALTILALFAKKHSIPWQQIINTRSMLKNITENNPIHHKRELNTLLGKILKNNQIPLNRELKTRIIETGSDR